MVLNYFPDNSKKSGKSQVFEIVDDSDNTNLGGIIPITLSDVEQGKKAWKRMSRKLFDWFIMFDVNCNNISVISWRSFLLVEETGVTGENHRRAASCWQTLSHNAVSSTSRLSRARIHNFSDDNHSLHM